MALKTGMEQKRMTKIVKRLGGAGLVVVLSVMLLGYGGSLRATGASAESPPAPPARFGGTVKVDGVTAPGGTVIEARVGSASCGVAAVDGSGRYILNVPALDPGATPNCGTYSDAAGGAVVTFYIGGKKADQTGVWKNFQFNELNLTYTTPPPSATPKPPATGSGVEGSSGGPGSWLFALLGLGALAFGVGGTTIARRSR
jgi:hypothetical protein